MVILYLDSWRWLKIVLKFGGLRFLLEFSVLVRVEREVIKLAMVDK